MARLLSFFLLLILTGFAPVIARASAVPPPRVFTFQEQGLVIVEIDPQVHRLRLMTAAALQQKNLTVKDWVKTYKLLGAINGGMYQTDYRTSVGLLINNGQSNNSHLKGDKTILAFDPISPKAADLPEMQIIDRQCQNFEELRPRYRSFLQGIRMVTCKKENAWKAGGEKWPIAALAADHKGRLLFLFEKEPMTPHDFIEIVIKLPLGIVNMMYLEGGPPAQLYFKAGDQELDLTGSYSSQATAGALAMRVPIPNILGIVAK